MARILIFYPSSFDTPFLNRIINTKLLKHLKAIIIIYGYNRWLFYVNNNQCLSIIEKQILKPHNNNF